ncbi:hypothetical protein CK627_00680 [Aeromonas dhakensis]|uniref:phage tail-collar fiber domain-containing protein n=1 Tax=Aeromonas dhakensis TaxID=196024 RepID=UPI000BAAFEA7|nr:phage tail protein [Aeromonas dhakensis]ASX09416.1 hypothetical protein CK627_00680 [Aeromonas dhakensis]
MSQVITNAFEQYWQSSLAAEQPVVLDEFILADIPNLDITSPIDPDAGLPPESQIVHRQNVDQRGRINTNAVAYSIVMDTTVGDFSFNAMYLRNKANGVIGMIVYKGRETKLKTDQTTGQTGNSLVKSMLMGYDQAAEATLTHVDAGTWQIDYAARLRGQDEDLRQLASQLYGHHTFIGDGFKVVQQDGAHQVTPGVAIIGGLRIELKAPEVIYPGSKPIGVWVDVYRAGSLLSEHQNHFTIITSVADLADHVDSSGYQHYVAKLGTVQADNTVVDGRGNTGSGGTGSIPDTFALWKRSMAEAGYHVVDGSFEAGGILLSGKDVLLHHAGGKAYSGSGPYPQTVDKGTDPTAAGNGYKAEDAALLRVQLSAEGGEKLVAGYANIEAMQGDTGLAVGNVVSTGGTRWKIVSTPTPLALQGGLFAELIGDLFIGDFQSNEVAKLNAYITSGLASSYPTRAAVEAYKYSMRPITVVFNRKVTSAVPLLLMHHVKYQRQGAGLYFNRSMQSGMHYAPANLNSCATEPVIFELSGGVFVRKTGVLLGTPDNPVGSDSDYITLSDGCDVSFDATTTTGVKLGFNFACCPGITGDKPSMGVAEQVGDAISVPKVAMLLSKSWSHSIDKAKLRSSQQSIVYSGANAGGVVTQPYCQRDGTLLNDAMPYSYPEAVSAGKNGSTAITILGTLDFTIDTPILENWKYPISATGADVTICDPHIEGDVAEHNVVLLNSYIDIDNWSGMLATGTGVMFHSLGQDGADRAVILRGMAMRLGAVAGLVGGTYTRAFLIIEDVSGAVTDFAKMGDWAAVRRFDLSIARSIYVDAVNGSDTNMGLTSAKPVKTISTAIKILNTINRLSPAQPITDINLKSDVTIDAITRAYKPFAIWGAFTLTAQAEAYIELYNCGMVQLRQPAINAVGAAAIRHLGGQLTILCDSTTVTGVAICQTAGAGSLHMNVNGGNTTGISKYVDGSGETAVTLIVNSASRNTGIDTTPTGANQLVVAKRMLP